MPIVVPLNCGNPGLHAAEACLKAGGISAFVWIGPDSLITDFTNSGEWDIDIASGAVSIVKNIKGLLALPSPIRADLDLGCGPKTQTLNKDYNFTWTDNSITEANSIIYTALMLTKGRVGMWNCSKATAPILYISRDFATFDVGESIPNTTDEPQKYEGSAQWNHLEMLQIELGVPVDKFQDVLP